MVYVTVPALLPESDNKSLMAPEPDSVLPVTPLAREVQEKVPVETIGVTVAIVVPEQIDCVGANGLKIGVAFTVTTALLEVALAHEPVAPLEVTTTV